MHERVGGPHLHQLVHLGEVRGHQPDRAGREVRACHVRQEVRDVLQSVAERPGQVRPIVQRVHLMDADLVDVGRSGGGRVLESRRAPPSARRWRAAR